MKVEPSCLIFSVQPSWTLTATSQYSSELFLKSSCYVTVLCFCFVFVSSLQAYVVLGQFLILKKDEELFRDWLKDTCGANAKQQGDCYGCLKEWCDAFL